MTDDIFDFGFTLIDESELEAVQSTQAKVEETTAQVQSTQDRLDKLYNAIVPLLNNLKKNPEREYILWPNRVTKIEQFEAKLFDIYSGK